MKEKTYNELVEAYHQFLPYGFLYDEKKGVVIFNRNYEAIFIKGAKRKDKTFKFNPEEEGFKPYCDGRYKIVPGGPILEGNNYFLYSSRPTTQKELAEYLIKVSKLLGCIFEHTDINVYNKGY